MKELSIEEKARAYDEALAKARNIVNSINVGLIGKDSFEAVFPELKEESEDERIRKALIQIFNVENFENYDIKNEEVIAWLERVGEQKPIIEMKSAEESLGIDSETYNKIVDECIYGEQKHTDKIEPKFKVGDWVVYQNQTFQVTKGSGNNLILQGRRYQTYFIEELCKPWTIGDARDGDVLVNGSNIFIFSHLSDTRAMGYCHINLDDRRFYDDKGKNECFGLIDAVFTPATKEQCDTLKKAIHEAGYMWDTEGKQLVSLKAEPVEQKPSEWSREDEQNLNAVLGFIDDEYLRRWLKDAIHVRYDKQEWSDEDKQYLLVCKNALAKYQVSDKWDAGIISRWLENRIKSQCHQSHWKPTKEQIKALRWVLNNVPYCTHKEEINGLLDQIIKL